MARVCVLLAAVSLVAASVAYADPLSSTLNSDLVRAHREKVAGAALIGVGTALALAGQILFIHAAMNPTHSTASCPGDFPGCPSIESMPGLEVIPGSVLVGVGGALLLSGIPVYIVGGAHARRAERSAPTLSFAPQLGAQGASLSARVRF